LHDANESSAARLVRRVRLNWAIGRSQGFGRLLDEKEELNPLRRAASGARRWNWRRRHGVPPGEAVPVFVVGVQRSGTNMLTRGLAASPSFEVFNEANRAAFHRFVLRPDPVIHDLVENSHHRFVLFKPLCDSHRTAHLLDALGTTQPGRAIWAFRDVDGRIRSALAHFGTNNLELLSEVAAGRGGDRWQAQGLSPQSLELIRSFDYTTMTPESAAALFWYLRNTLYFEQGLDRRDDVMPTSYNAFLRSPEPTMRALCAFLGLDYEPAFIRHITPRPTPTPQPLLIDPAIRAKCDELESRLIDAADDHVSRHAVQ
jgi:hypothetical protein